MVSYGDAGKALKNKSAFNVCDSFSLIQPVLSRSKWQRRCKCMMSLPPSSSVSRVKTVSARASKIVCIGDIHGQWDENDEMALRALKPDLALFVGDYGDEDVAIAKRVADFAATSEFNVATVFGNHDAFFTASAKRRLVSPHRYDSSCRVLTQMQLLVQHDVSYKSVNYGSLGISVCGGRPFSSGGPNWKHDQFYRQFLKTNDMAHSSEKISSAALKADFDALIFLSHCGPTGLGDHPNDPCGKDWGSNPGGDFGDSDLRIAIENARRAGKRVPLTVFGHMHKLLHNNDNRIMVKTEPDGESGRITVMLNTAVVPRHRKGRTSEPDLHHFQVVHTQQGGDVHTVEECWVSRNGEVMESQVIFNASLDPESIPRHAEQIAK